MIAVVARFIVAEGKVDKFLDGMQELAEKVRAEEKGCLQYELYRAREAERFIMIERYADKAALELHGKTSHFGEAMTRLRDCFAEAPQIEILKPV
jgi:quinol monooxygenase YgiN